MATFGEFSKKYLDDILAEINPSAATKKIGVNAGVSSMMNEDIRAIRSVVTDVIREGAIEGYTGRELNKIMRERLEKVKPTAVFIDKAGRKWNTESYFSMLNRTLHTQVARQTYQSSVADAGFDLVKVVGISNDADSPCVPYQGEVLSLSGNSKKYTSMAEAEANGLHHPNCIHTEVVYIEEVSK